MFKQRRFFHILQTVLQHGTYNACNTKTIFVLVQSYLSRVVSNISCMFGCKICSLQPTPHDLGCRNVPGRAEPYRELATTTSEQNTTCLPDRNMYPVSTNTVPPNGTPPMLWDVGNCAHIWRCSRAPSFGLPLLHPLTHHVRNGSENPKDKSFGTKYLVRARDHPGPS